jgi:sugar phosphate isomerase/epimerase
MIPHPLTRRRFVQSASIGLAGMTAPRLLTAATGARSWTIGCLNRPWTQWSEDEMLDGIHAAGYRLIGLQTPTESAPFNGPTAKPEYLQALKRKIAARGLTANVGRLRTQDAAPFAEATAGIRQQVDNARTLGLTTVIHTGTGRPEHYEPWYRLMRFAAGYAADAGIQVVTKPHGGVNAAAAELLVCLEKINHRNLGIWYDPGNIVFYTGKDPVQELEPVISHVTAFTAKDCTAMRGQVMIQFGQGQVNFGAVLRRLEQAGFNGPLMVESCAVGKTAQETTANAAANRQYLERVVARL